jgi:hypothetical protein
VIFGFRDGASPETIRQNFPSLSLAQVYGAITFYLSHPDESETYLQCLADKWNELEQGGQQPPEELQKKLAGARASVRRASMILRLLADADLNNVSGLIRRNPALDFKRAEDVPLEGLYGKFSRFSMPRSAMPNPLSVQYASVSLQFIRFHPFSSEPKLLTLPPSGLKIRFHSTLEL